MFIDHNGERFKAFAIAGYNDTVADTSLTYLKTPSFKGNEHPRECLSFWYTIKVVILLFLILYKTINVYKVSSFTYNI